MMHSEKEQLLALLDQEGKWCRDAEAHDANGDAVRYNDASAVAWDITGALCRLFGWHRACVLFEQLDRHIHGKRVPFGWQPRSNGIDAMRALQDYNDLVHTTFAEIHKQLDTMPTWRGDAPGSEAAEP